MIGTFIAYSRLADGGRVRVWKQRLTEGFALTPFRIINS
jgi:hypothetical protein